MFLNRDGAMFRELKMDFKTQLYESAKAHLENVLKKQEGCSFFGSRYSEKRKTKRCLLREYKDSSGNSIT